MSFNANIFVNSKGGVEQRFSPAVEFGRTFGIFDIGLATGRLSSMDHGPDTSRFVEFRPTINVFSKGRFAEALCLGGGYVFKAKQGLMTEICNSINFNVTEVSPWPCSRVTYSLMAPMITVMSSIWDLPLPIISCGSIA
ncbi:hypothetical protein [Mucilaginibacter jinjuensis]|uniref:Uncharacterized protein n=1 Tax=Mucilaginibacter jinjuensis TaxID=1176721 RepID=A0ABY7TAC3_9SPHI|nr:hypothetical protein [Mucilaginibacter jinjuensis]WCT13454.1 hypothetical protein PQO05_05840 [Mucilaginibacter jinjuensis]